MKTPRVSLLLGVSVLLLSALTVSAVSLNVRPNLQQFFTKDPPVSLSCVEDGQTVYGWKVKRTRGGRTEECGAVASDFGRVDGSSCVLDLTKASSTVYWCGTSSGQRSDPVTITVTDKDLILEIPALPVVTGSDVTLRCRNRNYGIDKAFFYFGGKLIGDQVEELTIHKVQQSDEGLYSCASSQFGDSPESRLRVRDPPTTSDPPQTTALHTPASTAFSNTGLPASSSPLPPFYSSFIVPIIAVVGSLVLMVLVVVGLVQLWRKQRETQSAGPGPGLRRLPAGWTSLSLLCCLTVLPAAGVAVLLYGLTLPPDSGSVSVIRLVLHLVVFCPFFLSTGVLMFICCSRRTGNKPFISMEPTQEEDQGLDKDYDDITADVTTEHNF